jgi:hypothetical protein
VTNTPLSPQTPRLTPPKDSRIKQLQNELQHKIQTFDSKRIDPRDDYGEQEKEMKHLVKQFDPFDDDNDPDNTNLGDTIDLFDRHSSIYETIPTNRVNNVLRDIQSNYGTQSRVNLRPTNSTQPVRLSPPTNNRLSPTETNESNLIDLN